MDRPTLSRYAAGGVRELRERGIEPTHDEVIWLHELGKRVESPGGERLDRIGFPVRLGNVYLWRLTVMASEWLHQFAFEWWRDDAFMVTASLAFASAHGRGLPFHGLGLSHYVDEREVRAAVAGWFRTLTVSADELESALDMLLAREDADAPPPDVKRQAESAGIAWADVLRDMEVLTGLPADHWATRMSRDDVVDAYARAHAIHAARGGAGVGSSTKQTDNAIRVFRRAIVAIVKAHAAPPVEVPQI